MTTDPYPDAFADAVYSCADMYRETANMHRTSWRLALACAFGSGATSGTFLVLGEPFWWISTIAAAFLVWQYRRDRAHERENRAQQRALERLAHPITLQHLWDRGGTPVERCTFVLDPIKTEQDLIGHPL